MGQVIKMYMLVGHCSLCINNVLALFPGVLHLQKVLCNYLYLVCK